MLENQNTWCLVDEQGELLKLTCFNCPQRNSGFTKMSSLLMHVESPGCGQTLESGVIGKLRRWLEEEKYDMMRERRQCLEFFGKW